MKSPTHAGSGTRAFEKPFAKASPAAVAAAAADAKSEVGRCRSTPGFRS